MTSKINAANVQLGESFVVPIENDAQKKRLEQAHQEEQKILDLANQNAQQIVLEAQNSAQKLLEDAQNEALAMVDEIKQNAHNEGFEAGRQEGNAAIRQELEDKILSIDNFAKCEFELKSGIIKSAHVDIVQLVIEIAKKVCTKSLELDEKMLSAITEQAINCLKEKENIKIIVNPQMAEQIYSISEELKQKIPQLESIKIIEDNGVSADGTIVESPLSRIDGRISSQISEIADKLMEKLNSTPPEDLQ